MKHEKEEENSRLEYRIQSRDRNIEKDSKINENNETEKYYSQTRELKENICKKNESSQMYILYLEDKMKNLCCNSIEKQSTIHTLMYTCFFFQVKNPKIHIGKRYHINEYIKYFSFRYKILTQDDFFPYRLP